MSEEEREMDGESDADKRAHHNALERKRRDHIKDSFISLRDALPIPSGQKNNANAKKSLSRAQILKQAAEYIQLMQKRTAARQQDVDNLKRQNKRLVEEISSLERQKNGSFTGSLESSKQLNNKGDSISAFDGGSGSDSSDTDDSNRSRRKRLKTSVSS